MSRHGCYRWDLAIVSKSVVGPYGWITRNPSFHCGNLVVVVPPNIGGDDERKNGEPVCISQNLVLKMLEEHKAVILQKYARAWLARRRFQSIRRFVLNIQLTYRVQRLQKKLEDQVGVPNGSFILTFFNRYILSWASYLAMQSNLYSCWRFTCTLSWETEAHFKGLLHMVVQVVHCTGQLPRRASGAETEPGSACQSMCSGTEMGCLEAGVPF